MNNPRLFFLFWLINSAFFYFVPMVIPSFVVTGNARLTPFLASIISGFLLAAATSLVMPVFAALKIKLKEEWQLGLAYFFVNVLVIWVIARYADLTGFGIANAWVAVILGAVLNLAQWVGWKVADEKK